MGGEALGVDGAARSYFNKPARDVTLAEAAMLVGLVEAKAFFPSDDETASLLNTFGVFWQKISGMMKQPAKNGMRQPQTRTVSRGIVSVAEDRCDEDRDLLARRLERGVETAVPGGVEISDR